jgi:hypothetical protein
MTSYSVVAPVLLARFQGPQRVFYRAWSPRRYGPVYQYDIIIEGEDNQHPMMNIEYVDFLHQVTDYLGVERGQREDGQTEWGGIFLDMTTDFHSTVPLEERGDCCFIIFMGESVFSPVFFLREDVELYLRFLENEFVTLRSLFRVVEIPHASI